MLTLTDLLILVTVSSSNQAYCSQCEVCIGLEMKDQTLVMYEIQLHMEKPKCEV